MAKAHVVTSALVVIAFAGCASTPAQKGASNKSVKSSMSTPLVPQTTSPVATSPSAEATYKDSAEVVTIEQLVVGRINAPTFSVGTVVTFSGTVTGFLHGTSGQVTGLILKDSSSDVLYVRLSARATTADEHAPGFMNVSDTVTIWGSWQAAAPVDNPRPRTYPAVVDERFLMDNTTGTSDNVN